MPEENKKVPNSRENRERDRPTLEREGARKVSNLADKAREKAEKKVRGRKTR